MSDSYETYQGCYGERVGYAKLERFIEDAFLLDDADEKAGAERFATCVWGHTGIGKSSCVKQFAKKPVDWRGKRYEGYDVRSIPIAQFEEMGDLHGLPDKHVLVWRCTKKKTKEHRWVPLEVSQGYLDQGWKIDHTAGTRTMYAPPDWVPTEPGPSILLLDDFNRAGRSIIQGIMQLLQDYGLMSWKLPPGCHIVLTANPDEQEYFVTSLDPAVIERFRCVTLDFDHDQWFEWATAQGLDERVTSYVIAYPESIATGMRTSPRAVSQFGRYLATVPDADEDRMRTMASSVMDDMLVAAILTFMERDFEMVIEPADIVKGKKEVATHVKDLMTREDKRFDVLAVTCSRLFVYLCNSDVHPDEKSVKNVQKFLTNEHLDDSMRYVLVDRLNRKADDGCPELNEWFLGNDELMNLISDMV